MAKERPLIGCTTYRKVAHQEPPIELIGLMPSYIEAILAAGGIPVLIPHGLSEADLQVVLAQVNGVLLPGGGDIEPTVYAGDMHTAVYGIDQERDRIELYVARAAVQQGKPLLAICRGVQVLNVALGGTLWVDIKSQKADSLLHDNFLTQPRNYLAHDVTIVPGSYLALSLGKETTAVNSLHHQGIKRLAAGLTPTAVAADGLIEGVEISGHPFAVGVQWHPENLIHDDPAMLALFKQFVQAAAKNAAQPLESIQ